MHLNPVACVRLLVFVLQDMVQVLSFFGSMSFRWPPALRAIYNSFSVLNLNVEIVAPECSVSVSFSQKWAAIQLLPVVFVGGVLLFVAVHTAVTRALWKFRLRKARRLALRTADASPSSFVFDTGVGVSITSMYYLYFGA